MFILKYITDKAVLTAIAVFIIIFVSIQSQTKDERMVFVFTTKNAYILNLQNMQEVFASYNIEIVKLFILRRQTSS